MFDLVLMIFHQLPPNAMQWAKKMPTARIPCSVSINMLIPSLWLLGWHNNTWCSQQQLRAGNRIKRYLNRVWWLKYVHILALPNRPIYVQLLNKHKHCRITNRRAKSGVVTVRPRVQLVADSLEKTQHGSVMAHQQHDSLSIKIHDHAGKNHMQTSTAPIKANNPKQPTLFWRPTKRFVQVFFKMCSESVVFNMD